jgi:hypothetical protein
VSRSLAVVRQPLLESLRPDAAWIKKHVPIVKVAHALGMRIRRGRAQCWRTENHRHGDADPSLHFLEPKNRARCFVCDMRGGHSNIDLVKHVLGVHFGDAVRWIAERFTVPNTKIGRPLGSTSNAVEPYRVGVHGSEFEVLIRSGLFGQLSSPQRSILITLAIFRDSDTGLTLLSYRGIMQYAGVGSEATVSGALKQLARLHAIEIHRGARVIGITRGCSGYRVTLDDPKFLDLCDKVSQVTREKVAEEREYRKGLRLGRMGQSSRPVAQNTNTAGGLRPPDPPFSHSQIQSPTQEKGKPSYCTGLNLSSVGEVTSNKALHALKREIGVLSPSELDRQKQFILEKYPLTGKTDTL